MGRKKQRSLNQRERSRNKRRKTEKYWIEDFPEIQSKGEACDITVCITRVELTDGHIAKTKESSEKKEDEDACISATHPKTSIIIATEDSKPSPKTPKVTFALTTEGTEDSVPQETKYEATVESGMLNQTTDADGKDLLSSSTSPSKAILEGSEIPGALAKSEEKPLDSTDSLVMHEDNLNVCEKREPRIFVKRTFETPPFRFPPGDFRVLPNGDCGDGIVNPYPASEVPHKYWAQRKRLLSRFDDGIKLDKEGWFSVTPEVIAQHIAKRMVAFSGSDGSSRDGIVLLDAFCGVGGNSIAFAMRPEVALVICVDSDGSRLKLAAHNSSVYGIPKEKLVFIEADACHVLEAYSNGCLLEKEVTGDDTKEVPSAIISGYRCGGLEALPATLDKIFLSPPWGGTSYLQIGPRHYNLSNIHVSAEVDGDELLRKASRALRQNGRINIAYFLPRNTNGLSLARSAFLCGYCGSVELEMNNIDGKFKTITAYIGTTPE
jgi:SAM-dependent methyltransferase